MSVGVAFHMFCKTCLSRGHQCPARAGSDECIFCEDKVPCPKMRHQATEHTRISSSPPILRDDALLSARALEKKRARPVAQSVSHQKKSGATEKHKSTEAIVVKQDESRRTCSVKGCETKLNAVNKTGRCAKH